MEMALRRQGDSGPSPGPRGEKEQGWAFLGFQLRLQTNGEPREEAVDVLGLAHN